MVEGMDTKAALIVIDVDRAKCTGLGICESIAPDLFEVQDDGTLVIASEIPEDRLGDVQQAIDGCPTLALRLLR